MQIFSSLFPFFRRNELIGRIVSLQVFSLFLATVPIISYEFWYRSSEIAAQARIENINLEIDGFQELAYDIAKLDRLKLEVLSGRNSSSFVDQRKNIGHVSTYLSEMENKMFNEERERFANKIEFINFDRIHESAYLRVQRASRMVEKEIYSGVLSRQETLDLINSYPLLDLLLVEDEVLENARRLESLRQQYESSLFDQANHRSRNLIAMILLFGILSCFAIIKLSRDSIAVPIQNIERIIGSIPSIDPRGDLDDFSDKLNSIAGRLKQCMEEVSSSSEIERLSDGFISLIDNLVSNCYSLSDLATIDPLCGVKNRRALESFGLKIWRISCRSQNTVGLVMIDVDFFKNYNDSHGHDKGDKCLVQVAKELSKFAKRPLDGFFRFGGEEFFLILHDVQFSSFVTIVADMVQRIEVCRIPHQSSPFNNVTISCGAVFVDSSRAITFEDARELADKNLYSAKSHGRNRFFVSEAN